MENKKEKDKKSKLKYYIIVIIPILSFISVGFLASYSFYLASVDGNDDNGLVDMKSADVVVLFNARNSLNLVDLEPGQSDSLEFSLTNTSEVGEDEDLVGYYSLVWNISKNEINDDNFVYTLSGTSTSDEDDSSKEKLVSGMGTYKVPTSSKVFTGGIINVGVTHKYRLTLELKDNGYIQNNLQNKKFESVIVGRGEPIIK